MAVAVEQGVMTLLSKQLYAWQNSCLQVRAVAHTAEKCGLQALAALAAYV